MTGKDFYTPTDLDSLRMENELLEFEVRFLKACLAETGRSANPLEKRLAKAEHSRDWFREHFEESESRRKRLLEHLEEASRHVLPPGRRAELENAERNLKLILERISRSKLVHLFRLKKEFRLLERQYLKDQAL